MYTWKAHLPGDQFLHQCTCPIYRVPRKPKTDQVGQWDKLCRADRELRKAVKQLNKDPILQRMCLQQEIEWVFNPPAASHKYDRPGRYSLPCSQNIHWTTGKWRPYCARLESSRQVVFIDDTSTPVPTVEAATVPLIYLLLLYIIFLFIN